MYNKKKSWLTDEGMQVFIHYIDIILNTNNNSTDFWWFCIVFKMQNDL